jgi:hypothetical protein
MSAARKKARDPRGLPAPAAPAAAFDLRGGILPADLAAEVLRVAIASGKGDIAIAALYALADDGADLDHTAATLFALATALLDWAHETAAMDFDGLSDQPGPVANHAATIGEAASAAGAIMEHLKRFAEARAAAPGEER